MFPLHASAEELYQLQQAIAEYDQLEQEQQAPNPVEDYADAARICEALVGVVRRMLDAAKGAEPR